MNGTGKVLVRKRCNCFERWGSDFFSAFDDIIFGGGSQREMSSLFDISFLSIHKHLKNIYFNFVRVTREWRIDSKALARKQAPIAHPGARLLFALSDYLNTLVVSFGENLLPNFWRTQHFDSLSQSAPAQPPYRPAPSKPASHQDQISQSSKVYTPSIHPSLSSRCW
jgi:hypothetical protein